MWDCFIFLEKGDDDLVPWPFFYFKLTYLRPTYSTVYINFMFPLKQEKPNGTLLPLYIFLNAIYLKLKADGQFDMNNWLFPKIFSLHYKKSYNISARLFMLRKKDNKICHLTSNQYNPLMRNIPRSWPVPRIM